ncbi:MAG TPA: ferric reductase-like transmembrane domain-containing protein [Acidimicrobiales bacterium]|jgi:sulfoxide reductase heme-binding subunit YedZ|nr:ferric reductase-like transmembrane domain-containing protein [Acidimicrobiales bacterium]
MIATTSTTLWYTTRATGIVALALLTATVVLGILTAGRVRSRSWPAFAQADLHKRISLLAMVFLAFHVLTSVLDTYVSVGWAAILVPFASSYRPVWTGLGTVGVDLMLAVAISSALRQRISAQAWRAIHWLAYGSWPVAMAHSLGMGTDASKLWMDALAGACSLAVLGSLTWRIGDYKKSKARAIELGSLTRTVDERRPAAQIEAIPARTASSESRWAHPTNRLLEKERS